MKQRGYERPTKGFVPIHMPKNTGAGIILSGIATAVAFGLIWQMWWLAAGGFVALVATAIAHTFNYKRDYYVPVEDVTRAEDERTKTLASLA